MYDTIEEARTHAARAARIHRTDISIVQEPNGFTLHGDPAPELTVVEVVPFTAT